MTSAGRTDVFVLELDSVGRLLWTYRFGSLGPDEVTGLAVAGDGSVYLGGNVLQAGSPFVAALAPDGAQRWLRSVDGGESSSLAGLAVGPDGAVYVSGVFQDRLRFRGRPVLGHPGGRGVYAARIDTSGDLVWIREVGTDAAPALRVSALAATAEGLLLGGSFRGSVDFDPGPARAMVEAETTTGFLAALDAGGGLRWANAPAAVEVGSVLGIAAGAGGRGAVIGLAQPRHEEHSSDVEPRGEEEEEEGSEVLVLGFAAPP